MEENTELITFVDVSEWKSKRKFEDMELSSLEEKVDNKNILLCPSESYLNERLEHLHNLLSLEPEELFKKYENFRSKNELLEIEINNDIDSMHQNYPQFVHNDLQVIQDDPLIDSGDPQVIQDDPQINSRDPKVIQDDPRVIKDGPQVIQNYPNAIKDGPQAIQDDPKVFQDDTEDSDTESEVDSEEEFNLNNILKNQTKHTQRILFKFPRDVCGFEAEGPRYLREHVAKIHVEEAEISFESSPQKYDNKMSAVKLLSADDMPFPVKTITTNMSPKHTGKGRCRKSERKSKSDEENQPETAAELPLMKFRKEIQREGAGKELRKYLRGSNFEGRLQTAIEKARNNVLPQLADANPQTGREVDAPMIDAIKQIRLLKRYYQVEQDFLDSFIPKLDENVDLVDLTDEAPGAQVQVQAARPNFCLLTYFPSVSRWTSVQEKYVLGEPFKELEIKTEPADGDESEVEVISDDSEVKELVHVLLTTAELPLMKFRKEIQREGAGKALRKYLTGPNFEGRLQTAIEKARNNVLPQLADANPQTGREVDAPMIDAIKQIRLLKRYYQVEQDFLDSFIPKLDENVDLVDLTDEAPGAQVQVQAARPNFCLLTYFPSVSRWTSVQEKYALGEPFKELEIKTEPAYGDESEVEVLSDDSEAKELVFVDNLELEELIIVEKAHDEVSMTKIRHSKRPRPSVNYEKVRSEPDDNDEDEPLAKIRRITNKKNTPKKKKK